MSKRAIESLAKKAGITLVKDIVIKDDRTYGSILQNASMGFGESYMEDYWEEGEMSIDEIVYKIQKAKQVHVSLREKLKLVFMYAISWIRNLQSIKLSKEVGRKHYDIGNELYENMLDKRMIYSCGYWTRGTKNIDQAQDNKLILSFNKLHLEPGMKV